MVRTLALIGAPTSAGAYAPGQEKAPAAFRAHGIAGVLERAGWELRDSGDVEPFRWRPDPSRPSAMNQDAVIRVATEVSARVAAALGRREGALVLGGDCTVELGTVAGALKDGRSTGLVYVDLDTDLNPPAASDGALDWTVVAHLLDVEGAARELSALGPRRPMLTDRELLYVAARPETPIEHAVLRARNLPVVALEEVHRDPQRAGRRAAEWGARFDRLLVHVDVDALSYTAFPIAENVRREDGLSLAELGALLGALLAVPNWAALTITEVNPDHAPEEAATFRAFLAMLEQAFAGAAGTPATR